MSTFYWSIRRNERGHGPTAYGWTVYLGEPNVFGTHTDGEPMAANVIKRWYGSCRWTCNVFGVRLWHRRNRARYDITEFKEWKHDGRDREAKADHRDTRPTGSTFAAGGPVASAGSTINVTFTGALPRGGASEGARPDELETVQEDMPILAHRAAYLRFRGDGSPFGAVNTDHGAFGADLAAQCHRQRDHMRLGLYRAIEGHQPHDAPGVDCQCGIYALPPDLESTYTGPNYVTLLVELSGRVIEHEKGYRAGHQRVVECKLPPCPYCARPADWVDVRDGLMVQATCDRHRADVAPEGKPEGAGRVWVHVDDVAATLPVPLTRAGVVHDAPT